MQRQVSTRPAAKGSSEILSHLPPPPPCTEEELLALGPLNESVEELAAPRWVGKAESWCRHQTSNRMA